jgi:hypothetical protein
MDARQLGGLRPQRRTLLKGVGKEAGNQVPSTYEEMHMPYSRLRRAHNTFFYISP